MSVGNGGSVETGLHIVLVDTTALAAQKCKVATTAQPDCFEGLSVFGGEAVFAELFLGKGPCFGGGFA